MDQPLTGDQVIVMWVTVAVVGMALLVGLAAVIGRAETRSLEQAYRNIARQRRANGEERRRLEAWERDLTEWAHTLDLRRQMLDKLDEQHRTRGRDGRDRGDTDRRDGEPVG